MAEIVQDSENTHLSQAIMFRLSSYLVLQIQYSLSSSAATVSSSSSSGFSEPSGPTDPAGITEFERERDTDAATEPLLRDMTDGLPFRAGPVPASEALALAFGAGFARGFALVAALGLGAG